MSINIDISIKDIIWLLDHKDELEDGDLRKEWIELFISYMNKATNEASEKEHAS